jgi:exodeoxyribonuclease V alpha subunit
VSAQVVIVDEASMCDLETAAWLASSIAPTRTRLLWAGDVQQLPSVGHGAVLRDLIDSGAIPVARLTKVHRQGSESRITANANHILDRVPLDLSQSPRGDWSFTDISVAAVGSQYVEVARQAIVRTLEDLTDVSHGGAADLQVMAPLRKGPLGTDSLNHMLQNMFNPTGTLGPDIGGDARVRLGDRVLVTRNLYDLPEGPVFNGQQGTVVDVSVQDRVVAVQIEGRVIALSGAQRKLLQLAWAVTVHRAQGDEYAHALLCYDHRAHAAMLQPEVLYTAVTRARRSFHLVGTRAAISRTLGVTAGVRRLTGLGCHIRELLAR